MHILFINSENFWLNGWLNTPASLQTAMDTLKSFGITVSYQEIKHAAALETLLDHVPKDTLIWPNAYYTFGPSGQVEWLQHPIERRNLPYVGTSVQGLKNMLNKTQTHKILNQAGVPTPEYLTISRSTFAQFEEIISNSNLSWPMVIKPSSESCSMGILKAETPEQAKQHIAQLLDEFPQSEALLEAFLSNEDITCGYLALKSDTILLPTYYKSLILSGKKHVAGRDLGTGPWGGSSISMPTVNDTNALHQLRKQMPALTRSVGIAGITRVDARMDAMGTLKFFDVNGMPALSYPKSVLVRQVRECYPKLSAEKAYAYLLKTILAIAAERFNLTVPNTVSEDNLFSMHSDHVVRISTLKSA